jgi:hypothetical protein
LRNSIKACAAIEGRRFGVVDVQAVARAVRVPVRQHTLQAPVAHILPAQVGRQQRDPVPGPRGPQQERQVLGLQVRGDVDRLVPVHALQRQAELGCRRGQPQEAVARQVGRRTWCLRPRQIGG